MRRPRDAAALLCALLGALLLAGSGSGSKLKGPELSLKGAQHVVQAGQTLHLTCRGRAAHSWSLPETVRNESRKLSITQSACGSKGRQFCSTLNLTEAQAHHTGFYSCKYLSTPGSKEEEAESTTYIFINDTGRPFVEVHSEMPEIIYMNEGRELVIPCRVTSPAISVTLKKFPLDTLVPDGKRITWDSRKGFTISRATYREIGLLTCETTIHGHVHKTNYLTLRQTNIILDVQMSPPGPVKLLRGQTLTLDCTATTPLNTRVQMTWSYPAEEQSRAAIRRRIDQSDPRANVFHSVLVIDRVQSQDRGLYTCHVASGPTARAVNASVHVYGKPFISVNFRKQQTLETVAGRKSCRVSMKVKAFPRPEVAWLKDGLPAMERSARYLPHGYSLIIKDVAAEDAGEYTILLGARQSGVNKNLTATLIVNVKPQIYEKAVSSLPDLTLHPLGSRQSLTCTVHGVPQPVIEWFWQPCDHSHPKARYGICSHNEESVLLRPDSSTGNRIESITQRTAVIEGKNKTASTLVVAESRIPGIYSCVASNKVGTAKRSINFYITDVPNGFQVSLEKTPAEGEDLRLSCTANRFLYGNLTWLLLRTAGNRTVQHSISKQRQAASTALSATLDLVIRNVSLEASGTYACRARNLFTGEEILQKKEVAIRDQEAPHLLRNLSDHTVAVSGSATLDCHANGVPEPQITWFKNNHKIQQEPGIILGPGSSTLFIERVTEEDEGIYHCKATNQKGSAESWARLTVQERSCIQPLCLKIVVS
ncbi:vascular endothelial growth factor receptor 1 isoform X2 [Rousettus aegyptiacus]|uniref:vascular endothelial growth factor receptor 1 isoform X2 n=1 Tax=Rousettus aegyptiacus TaxID=9407 RepID=UPI00168D12C4|nr:vascular endothelial growth factor receptor 1 isoform X2 [Rousettus aegyptiacus]